MKMEILYDLCRVEDNVKHKKISLGTWEGVNVDSPWGNLLRGGNIPGKVS